MSDRALISPARFLSSRQKGIGRATSLQIKSALCVPQRMRPEARLTGHQGCVNTVSWNREGTLLLSGSDDCQLNIYRRDRRCLLQSIPSGHTANIFSAQFIPRSNDREIVSCAGNGTIHLTHADRPDLYGHNPFNCHQGATYEVLVSPYCPSEFLSCGEDGYVRVFDLRRKRKCLCRHNKCRENVLVSVPDSANSMSLHPLHPSYLLVAGGDSGVREFDRRMLTPDYQPEVALYRPTHLDGTSRKMTCVRYSPDGHQLLASYSSEYLYLYNREDSKRNVGIVSSPGVNSDGPRHFCLPLTTSHLQDPSHLIKHEVSHSEKRIRFRSDWSDTGPAARPDESAHNSDSTPLRRMFRNLARRTDERSAAQPSDDSGDQESTHISVHYMDVPGEEDGVIEGQVDRRIPIVVSPPPSEMDDRQEMEAENHSQESEPPPRGSAPSPPPYAPCATSRQPVSWFKGHRNVRTMIKQANFWGDSHLVSGSDCGRVFFWNKWTAEIEMFLEADRHVVNCVQPHPLDATLATSGIDYDIKLFSPCGRDKPESRDQLMPNFDEVISVNDKMLEDSYNTFSIPLISLLRVLLDQRNNDNDT